MLLKNPGVWATAALGLVQGIAGLAVSSPSEVERRATPANNACATASAAAAQWVKNYGDKGPIYILAEQAYNCLRSVPNVQTPALELISSFRTLMDVQSTIEYLANPPTGYLIPGLNLLTELDRIEATVKRNGYGSEYDFQIDLMGILTRAHDGHLYWQGDLATGVFKFERAMEGLATISADGISAPQIYAISDLLLDGGSKYVPQTRYTPSPVVAINGKDAVTYLLTLGSLANSHDPDTQWNVEMFRLPYIAEGKRSFFEVNKYYHGAQTSLTFANGTTVTLNNFARVSGNLGGMSTGEDMYKRFCSGQKSSSKMVRRELNAASSAAAAPAKATAIPYHPKPVVKHPDDSLSGYYLTAQGLTDVAVLQLLNFHQESDDDTLFMKNWQIALENFFKKSVADGKTKLVIDLQGNGGGFVDLGTETFAQLFPNVAPNSKSNMRASPGMQNIVKIASDNVTAAERTPGTKDDEAAEDYWVPFAYQSVIDEKGGNYQDVKTFYGPYKHGGGSFTNYFQNNYTDPNSSDFNGQGIIITGTNNRKGYKQPFAAENIVVLTDGNCGSTCTVFSEYLKNYMGIQFITVGGRPQDGPMQAIGGVKGAQVFNAWFINLMLSTWYNPLNALRSQAVGTAWAKVTDIFARRSSEYAVNARNHFRQGDTTETPLQFVYEAADCRIWYTWEMMYDATFIWNRVATIAFKERKGTTMNSKYCVAGSTGHPTSIGGGVKKGSIGPQTPPEKSKYTSNGWKLTGPVVNSKNLAPSTGSNAKGGAAEDSEEKSVSPALGVVVDACAQYAGDAWLIKLMCNAL